MLCDDYVFVGYSEEEDFNKYQVARTNRRQLLIFYNRHFS